jgi:hypothetical protein
METAIRARYLRRQCAHAVFNTGLILGHADLLFNCTDPLGHSSQNVADGVK